MITENNNIVDFESRNSGKENVGRKRGVKAEESLEQVSEKWKGMDRKTHKQRERAELFYEKHLMPKVVEEFIKNNIGKLTEIVEYLIISVGMAFEPLVLIIALFKPRQILFLYTKKTEETIDKIVRYLNLNASAYQKRSVEESNPLGIYQEIKTAYLDWGRPARTYISVTGGTRAMSVAGAMAGALINARLAYVGAREYLPDFRKPNPGSETVYFIENPMEVFGDLELEKIFALIERHNYSGAQEKLKYVKERIPDPVMRQQMNFVYLLVKAYGHWDALEFPEAYRTLYTLNRQLLRDGKLNKKILMMDYAKHLRMQEQILGHLQKIPKLIEDRQYIKIPKNKEIITSLIFTMYANAMIREKQHKYDISALLLYRLLEMIGQRRLAIYNLHASKMEYLDMDYKEVKDQAFQGLEKKEQLEFLKERVNALKQRLFGKNDSTYLPDQAGLLDGFIILAALHDPIMYTSGRTPVEKLKRIRSMLYLRNNSILAHGLSPVRPEEYMKFKRQAVSLLEEFCKTENIDFQKMSGFMRFVNPMDSVYCSVARAEKEKKQTPSGNIYVAGDVPCL